MGENILGIFFKEDVLRHAVFCTTFATYVSRRSPIKYVVRGRRLSFLGSKENVTMGLESNNGNDSQGSLKMVNREGGGTLDVFFKKNPKKDVAMESGPDNGNDYLGSLKSIDRWGGGVLGRFVWTREDRGLW